MPKIILISHQKGGVGKSTITNVIANQIRELAKVAIIDMDLQGSLYKTREHSNVEVFSSKDLEDLKNSDFEFIFIDTPPYLSNELPNLMDSADLIIIPTKVGIYDFLAIEDTIELIEKLGKEKQALIVFNMVKPNTSLTAEMNHALSKYKVHVSNNYLSDLVAYTRSSITAELDNKKAQRQVKYLTKEILTILSN